MNRVQVNPVLLRWARERAGLSVDALVARFPKVGAWESGEAHPTLKQLERFAKATFTPIGFLFLEKPPVERVPIPDFRTVAGAAPVRPSPDLLDMVYLCQQRQVWYHDFARSEGAWPLPFVGSAGVGDDEVATATKIRRVLGFDVEQRRRLPTWTDALRLFVRQADEAGILTMVSGVVGGSNRRGLDPDEFRGFALADPIAPLVFINGADTKAAQMFTLAHELAHVWLGESGVSDARAVDVPNQEIERWCNRVAAEVLAPLRVLRDAYDRDADLPGEVARLARRWPTIWASAPDDLSSRRQRRPRPKQVGRHVWYNANPEQSGPARRLARFEALPWMNLNGRMSRASSVKFRRSSAA